MARNGGGKRMKKLPNRVLCVDDDQDTRELYRVMLYEYEVTTAASVPETLLLSRRTFVDLYVLDAWINGGTGIGLCKEIRRFDPNTPVIFVSGAVDETHREEALKAGAQAYLTKPVAMFDLRGTVESLIRQTTSKSIQARCAELRALSDAITEFTSKLDHAMATPPVIMDTTRPMLRIACYSAFTRAGGSRAEFERFWPGSRAAD